MTIKQHFMNARSDLSRNRMRTWLSMLGIIIWVFAVIVMLAIGNGTQQDIVDRINSAWTNLLTVYPGGSTNMRMMWWGWWDSATLDDDMIEYISENISNIDIIAPTINGSKQIIYGSDNINATIIGVTTDYLAVKNLEMIEWFFIDESNIENMDKVVVLWNEIATEIFGTEDPVGEDLKMENTIVSVIGVLDENSELDNSILVPITTAQIRILGSRDYSNIIISAENVDIMDQTQSDLENWLTSYLGFDEDDEVNFSVSSQEDMLEMVSDITGVMSAFLGWIAAISLLVWWIGVMNIMLVSVTERIKEIWIRKAIGASKKDILSQFLAESILLSLMWWIIGIILSFIIVFFVNKFMTAIVGLDAVIIAFCSAVAIGIIFGILPARNAANLKPIDALRFE